MNSLNENLRSWWSHISFSVTQKRSLLSISGLVIALSIFLVVRGTSQEIPLTPPELMVTESIAQVTVDVAGAVNAPGVYSLPVNSRVIDAIKAAGDSAPGADLSTINLARVLSDGEQIYVDSTVVNSAGVRVSKSVHSGPININRATAHQLDALDGVGPVIAQRIVDYRKINGSFLAIEDLQKVSGIGVAKFNQIKAKVRI